MPRGPSPAPRGRQSGTVVHGQAVLASATPPQMMYSLPSLCSGGADSDAPVTHFQSPSLETLVVQDTLGHTPQPHGHNYSATTYSTSQLTRPQVSKYNTQPAGTHP